MKKLNIIICIFLSFFFFQVFAQTEFENQGFEVYQQQGNQISFLCDEICFMIVSNLKEQSQIKIEGKVSGDGSLSYGFFLGGKIFLGGVYSSNQIPLSIDMTKYQLRSQLPDQLTSVIRIEGPLSTDNLKITLSSVGFLKKIGLFLNSLFYVEQFAPHSINLRYGDKVAGISIIKRRYWIAIVGILGILFIAKNKNEGVVLGISSIVILYALGGLVNWITWTTQDYQTYVMNSEGNKAVGAFGEYIPAMKYTREKLGLDIFLKSHKYDTCTIYFDTSNPWPFKNRAKYVYLQPCEFVETIDEAEYIIQYNSQTSYFSNFEQIGSSQGVTLYQSLTQ